MVIPPCSPPPSWGIASLSPPFMGEGWGGGLLLPSPSMGEGWGGGELKANSPAH